MTAVVDTNRDNSDEPFGAGLTGAARYPLSAFQRDIWTSAELAAGTANYVTAVLSRLAGDVDIDVLTQCIARVWGRNDGVRLQFGVYDGVPYQSVADEMPVIEWRDVSDAADPAVAAEELVRGAVDAPIDLTAGVSLRVMMIREGTASVQVLLLSHHVAMDGTGLFNLAAHILADYASQMRTGSPAELPATSFIECLGAERDYRGSEQWTVSRDRLVERVGEASPALFDRPGVGAGRSGVVRHRALLDRAVVNRLREHDVAFFPYLCAIIGTYLTRVLRTEEVMLGVPLANRNTAQEMGAVGGNFANMLPLRVDVGAQRSLVDVVAGLRSGVRELKQCQQVSLGDLMGELRRGGMPSGPLFDVTVNYLRLPGVGDFAEFVQGIEDVSIGSGQLALAVHVHELDHDGPLDLVFDYAADLFDDDFPIESVERHITALFSAGIDALDGPLSALPMLSADEYDTLIDRRGATVVAHCGQSTVIGRIMEQAGRTPEATALIGADGVPVSYGRLAERVVGLAEVLGQRGVGVGDHVAVHLRRGPDLLVAILAAMHAGAAYVPVDPGYPAERIAYLLEDSGAKVVLTDDADSLSGDVPAITPDSWSTDSSTATDAVGAGEGAGGAAPAAGDAAYVIYTSGSTGRPKGVVVEHRSVINRLAWMQRRYPIGAGDVILQKTPISFDVSVWELFWWAIEGASVALLAPGAEKDPAEILAAIAQSQVTVMHFVPSMLTPFLDQLETSPGAVEQAASLRVAFCSGEALLPHQVTRWNRVFAHLGAAAPRLVNLYGPTEATVDVSYFDCPVDPEQLVRRVPIGKPIDNIRLYVLDGAGRPQPAGVPGELCISGVGVARGYLNRPELQAEKFVSDPFYEGARMYRTGDLARWLADGEIEYLGRIDRQVKIRGNRVELGEVENALAGVAGVTDAVVIDVNKPDRGTYLAAYYVAAEALAPSQLRTHLSETLPDFMLPAVFQRIDAIPLTPSGKADRTRLAAMSSEVPEVEQRAPQTDVEVILAEVLCEVLGVTAVSVHDNFYDLGGDSILALRVRALAEARGLILAVRDIAQYPTIAELAGQVSRGSAAAWAAVAPFELVAGVDRPRLGHLQDAYPLTRLQLGMLFHSSERSDSTMYHDVFRYSLQMPWNEQSFGAALDDLVARHPLLRTGFDLGGFSEPLQLVYAPGDEALDASNFFDVVDLRAVSGEQADAVVAEGVSRRRNTGYQLDRPGLFHFDVYLMADRIDVVFAFHHAILDGWSVATVVAELLQEYRGIDRGLVPPMGPLAPGHEVPSFAEYVRAERDAISDPTHSQYWTHVLAEAPPIQIPGWRPHTNPGGAAPTERVQRTSDIPADAMAAAARLAKAEHVPVKSVYLAAHLLTVGLFAAQRDITTGLVTHGRPELALAERTAGLFLNTAPLRVNTTGCTGGEVVHAVFDQERAGTAHQLLPLFQIQQQLDTSVDIAFNYTNFHTAAAIVDALDVTVLDIDIREDTNFALLINVIRNPLDDTTALRIDGDPALYTPEQLDLIGETFLAVLHQITTTPGDLVANPTSTSVAALSQTQTQHVPTATVVTMFADIAAQQPDSIALQFGSGTMTYGELDDLVQRVAAGLLAHGARPGDRIAVALERSAELIATVLGIAAAGMVCVPLDVSYPAARLHAMLEQAEPAAMIVDSVTQALIEASCPRIVIAELLASTRPDRGALPTIDPQQPASILFTSGSTGTPKGVVMPHRALANLVQWQLSIPSGWLREQGRAPATLQFAPLSFDVSFQEIYSTLCGGGRLVLLTTHDRHDLPELLRTLDDAQVERVILPYVALQALADIAVRRGPIPAHLKIIASSGEQLRITDEIRQLCAALDGVLVENQYGPTETHVVTSFTMTGDPQRFPPLPPIGTPIANVEVLVLDEQGLPVPDGVPGEIFVAGTALADGYYGRPDLTNEVFQSHPAMSGVRMYRTGDIGRRLPGGALVTDGRRGNQVKIRGHRVEPMEVELAVRHAAAPQPGITDVAVIARRSADGSSSGNQLVAFLVGDPDQQADQYATSALHDALQDVLPNFMIPARWEWIDVLPRTASGKRDDRTLATMPLENRTVGHVAPRDEHEAVIAELMADALGIPRVGVFDDFWALNGNSLTAVRLVVAIEQRYGLSIPMSKLTAGATAAELANLVRDRAAIAYDPCIPIKPSGSRPPLFLVHPIGGNVLCYVELSKHLPDDQPLYGLQATGIDAGTTPAQTISEMAGNYVAAIRRVQPDGPYHIGGWSLGGYVAYEMACQLTAQGQEVSSLFLLDPVALRPGVTAEFDDETLYEAFMWELVLAKRGSDAPVDRLPTTLTSEHEVLDYIHQIAVKHGVLPPAGSRDMVRRLFAVFRHGAVAMRQYLPPTYDSPVTLFRAAQELPEILRPVHDRAGSLYHDPTNGWDGYVTGDLRVIETPGDHLTMVENPNVAELAGRLGELLTDKGSPNASPDR